jgi:hypothetical protein
MWEFSYTGSGTNTPSLANMKSAMDSIKANLPEGAQFLSSYLMEREQTSRYKVYMQAVSREEWLQYSMDEMLAGRVIPRVFLQKYCAKTAAHNLVLTSDFDQNCYTNSVTNDTIKRMDEQRRSTSALTLPASSISEELSNQTAIQTLETRNGPIQEDSFKLHRSSSDAKTSYPSTTIQTQARSRPT